VFEFAGSREGKYQRPGVWNKLGYGIAVGTKNFHNDFREGETKTQFQSLQVYSHATRWRFVDCVGRAGDYYPIIPSKRELNVKVYYLPQFVAEGGVNIMRPWSVFRVRPGRTFGWGGILVKLLHYIRGRHTYAGKRTRKRVSHGYFLRIGHRSPGRI